MGRDIPLHTASLQIQCLLVFCQPRVISLRHHFGRIVIKGVIPRQCCVSLENNNHKKGFKTQPRGVVATTDTDSISLRCLTSSKLSLWLYRRQMVSEKLTRKQLPFGFTSVHSNSMEWLLPLFFFFYCLWLVEWEV